MANDSLQRKEIPNANGGEWNLFCVLRALSTNCILNPTLENNNHVSILLRTDVVNQPAP